MYTIKLSSLPEYRASNFVHMRTGSRLSPLNFIFWYLDFSFML